MKKNKILLVLMTSIFTSLFLTSCDQMLNKVVEKIEEKNEEKNKEQNSFVEENQHIEEETIVVESNEDEKVEIIEQINEQEELNTPVEEPIETSEEESVNEQVKETEEENISVEETVAEEPVEEVSEQVEETETEEENISVEETVAEEPAGQQTIISTPTEEVVESPTEDPVEEAQENEQVEEETEDANTSVEETKTEEESSNEQVEEETEEESSNEQVEETVDTEEAVEQVAEHEEETETEDGNTSVEEPISGESEEQNVNSEISEPQEPSNPSASEENVIHLPYFNENTEESEEEEPTEQQEEPSVPVKTDLEIYMLAAAQQGIAIAEYFDARSTTALDQQLLLHPYSNMDEFPEIEAFALSLVSGLTTDEEKIQAIYNWVDTEITYSYYYMNATTYYTFKNKAGVCSQKATLMHDMLSAVGIQSYYVSGVWGNTTMTVHHAINSYYYGLSGKHAWIIAKIDGEWKYYDPTIQNYAMSAEELANSGYSCTSVDSIHCLPETYDISLTDVTTCETEAPVLILRDGEIGSYRNNTYFNEYKYRNFFNGNFYIYKETYSVVVFTSHLFPLTENAVIEQDKMFSSIIWYQASTLGAWTNPSVYKPADYGTRFWIFTPTGRKIHGLDTLQYLIGVYGVEGTNTLLSNTVFSVQEDGLYITHQGEAYLLESFEEHNTIVCHYNFLD